MPKPKTSGSFKKGHKGHKKPGAVNKITQQARELFVEILEGQVPNIKLAFAEVYENDKTKFLELYAKYAQYFVPRKVDITTKDNPIDQVFKWGDQEIKF